ncbi:unnamed protein product [Sympodiomycopsis kandeliae]
MRQGDNGMGHLSIRTMDGKDGGKYPLPKLLRRSKMSIPSHRQTPSAFAKAESLESIARPLPSHALPSHAFFDLAIIGAGPAALAVVSRILETRPAALYTEQEHHYLHWLSKSGNRQHAPDKGSSGGQAKHGLRLVRTRASGRGAERVIVGEKKINGTTDSQAQTDTCACPGEMKIIVIDKVGQGWMAHWHNMFRALEIQHLRSPLFFHPCPADLDSLLAFAHRHGRNSVGDPRYASPICSHAKGGRSDRTQDGRGRDRKVKRLACCADLDSSDKALGDSYNTQTTPTGRPDLVEIPGVVGAEKSKHKKHKQRQNLTKHAKMPGDRGGAVNERERKDYFTPSTELFRDFVAEDIVKRYGLSTDGNWPSAASALKSGNLTSSSQPALTVKGEVDSMAWANITVDDDVLLEGFYLTAADGASFGAKAVVSAAGPAGQPSIPEPLKQASKPMSVSYEQGEDAPPTPGCHLHGPGWCHSAALALPNLRFPPPAGKNNQGDHTLVVVGGGLTSAQVCDIALRRGFDKVKLLLRGHLKVKPFDISLDWMGRYSNLRKMQYWQEEDPVARLEMLRDARQGGSMTQPYAKLMKQYEESGRLEICTHTEIEDAEWTEKHQWKIWTKRNCPLDPKSRAKESYLRAQQQRLQDKCAESGQPSDGGQDHIGEETKGSPTKREPDITADYIVTASAFMPNFSALPWMSQVARQYPVRQEGGLPLLTEHLQYGQLPLFVVGMYAGLQIGPAAGNLGGIREGADRVVTQLQTLIQPPSPDDRATSIGDDEAVERCAESALTDEEREVDIAPFGQLGHTHMHREFGHLGFGALALEG